MNVLISCHSVLMFRFQNYSICCTAWIEAAIDIGEGLEFLHSSNGYTATYNQGMSWSKYHFAKYHFAKYHFAKYRFAKYRFVSFHFVSQSTVSRELAGTIDKQDQSLYRVECALHETQQYLRRDCLKINGVLISSYANPNQL